MRAPGRQVPADPLIAWIEEHGGHADGVGIGRAGTGRGLFATRALTPGETVLRVPAHAMVRSPVVAARTYGLGLVARYGPPVLLAAWMVRARRAHEPDYAALVEVLPADLSGHPLFFSGAALHALRGSSFLDLVEARRQRLLEEHAWIRARVPGFADLDASEWVIARTLVTSRSFACGEGEALVPMAELVNHALEPVATWTCDPTDGFRLQVERALPAGAEITHSYGPKSNARLLLGYGFTLAGNPVDDLELHLGDIGAFRLSMDEDAPEVARLLTALGAGEGRGAARRARAALATVCRDRLARLPDAEPVDDAEPGVASALAVRESERRVLGWWAHGRP